MRAATVATADATIGASPAPKIGYAIATIFGSLGIVAAIYVVVLSAATGWLWARPNRMNGAS